MSASRDPYRTLGLVRGASPDEIRRAYRRLAKEHHPDSAGEAALPRFLAIQAAYEALLGDSRTRRPGAGPPASPTGPAREAWRADPGRARTTRNAQAGRAGRSRAGGPGEGPAGPTDRPPRPGGRRRPPNKATPGSTTYDADEEEPFDPEWSGATWYGTSSGTYWTINPREYADPRKHGPEYQRRAREAGGAGPADWADLRAGDRTGAASGPGEAASGGPDVEPGPGRPADEAPGAPPEPSPSAASPVGARFPSGPPRGIAMRVGLALVAWPPIGAALAAVAGELTGCGRFAAGCLDPFGVWTWLAQLAIIAILLAAPSAAALSAVGTLAVLAASVPTAIFLSATGGAREPAASATVLGVVLAIAWLAGVVAAASRRRAARVP